MDFSLTPEQTSIASSVRAILQGVPPGGECDSHGGYDQKLWTQMQELGLPALLVPEAHGGLGLSAVELVVVAQELGRKVVPSPFLSTAVAAVATLDATDDDAAKKRWLPAIAAGELTAAVAIQEDPHSYRCDRPNTTATRIDDDVYVTGTKHFVLGGADAGLLLVLADLDGTPTLCAVDRHSSAIASELEECLDPTLPLATLRFDETPATPLMGDGLAAVAKGLDFLILAQAADSLGGAEECLAMAVEYAKIRHQFGRPIGGFQAIKHKCADIYVAVEIARTAVLRAAWALSADLELARTAIPVAAAESGRAYTLAATDNIQVHGGIGFTWEHPAHWYFKRARTFEVLHGTTTEHYEAILADLPFKV